MQLSTNIHSPQTEGNNSTAFDLSLVAVDRDAQFLRLFPECVKECGIEAAITLSVFAWRTSKGKYFYGELGELARLSGVSESAIDRHMVKLEKHGYIRNQGRQGRRTSTRSIPLEVHSRMEKADWRFKLPTWALMLGMGKGELTLLAISFHRTTGLLGTETRFDHWDGIKEGEYNWTSKWIAEQTGIDTKTIRTSRAKLVKRGLISDEYDASGMIGLTPTSDYMTESVYVTAEMLESLPLRYVGMLDSDQKSTNPKGKSDARHQGKVMLGKGKSDASTSCMTSELNDDKELYAATNAAVCFSSSMKSENKDRKPKPKRPLHQRLIAISGRDPQNVNEIVWKDSIGFLALNGKNERDIERVFRYAINSDKWFSAIGSRKQFPIAHFVKCYSDLERVHRSTSLSHAS